MHARAETIDTLRTFATSFAQRRGILPVMTFNVGQELGKKTIQHVLRPRDGKPLGIAVIWHLVPNRDGDMIAAFVMATTAPNALIGTVTDRMPAILPPEHWGLWLGETYAPMPEIKAVLVPYAGDLDMTLQPKAPPKPGKCSAPNLTRRHRRCFSRDHRRRNNSGSLAMPAVLGLIGPGQGIVADSGTDGLILRDRATFSGH